MSIDLAAIKARAQAGDRDMAPDVAALIAEVEKGRRAAQTLGEIIDRQCRDVLDVTGLHHLVDEDGDGDWGAVWDGLHAMRAERDAVAATVQRVREIAFDPDTISALEHGAVGTPPNVYGLTTTEAVGYGVDALRDIRAALDGAK